MKPKVKVKSGEVKEKKAPAGELQTASQVFEQRSVREKALLGDIEKKFGLGLIAKASEIGFRATPRLSTGVFAMDVALGGGWAKGRVNLIWGPQSSCKTYLMLKMIAAAQLIDFFTNLPLDQVKEGRPYKIAYIDVEGAFDFDWAQRIGVNLQEMYYVRPENAEQAAQILESLMASGVFDIVVLDSLAAMTPEKEIDGEMGDQHVGTHARLNNQMFRKVQAMMNKIHNEDSRLTPTFFVINQERGKIGVFFGSNKVKPGGLGQDFYTTIEVHTSAHKMEYFDQDEKTMPKHAHFSFKVEKNKVAPPKVEGKFILAVADDPEGAFSAGDVMEDVTVHNYAERLGLFKKIDASTWDMCGKTYKRKGDLVADWYQNPVNAKKLRLQMLKILFPKVFHVDIQKEDSKAGPSQVVANETEEGTARGEIQSQDSVPA